MEGRLPCQEVSLEALKRHPHAKTNGKIASTKDYTAKPCEEIKI